MGPAFGRRCIPAGGVAPSSNIPDILGRRALPAGRLAALDAAPPFMRWVLVSRLIQRALNDMDRQQHEVDHARLSVMRILACADVHGRPAVYQWLVATAREHEVEAILLAGDLLGCPDGFDSPEDAQRYEAQTVIGVLEAAGVPVLYIMGNGDLQGT
jgi:Calcineurin-like phosphoesterase